MYVCMRTRFWRGLFVFHESKYVCMVLHRIVSYLSVFPVHVCIYNTHTQTRNSVLQVAVTPDRTKPYTYNFLARTVL